MEIIHKSNNGGIVSFKSDAKDPRAFSGCGNAYNRLDSHRDVLMPGVFHDSIKEDGERIKILWQHRTDLLLGAPEKLWEDDEGVHFNASMTKNPIGDRTLVYLKEGTVTECSVGMSPQKWEYGTWGDTEIQVRKIYKAKLWEISLVTWGANQHTNVSAKSAIVELADAIKAGTAKREDIEAFKSVLYSLEREDENKQLFLEKQNQLEFLKRFI